MAFKQNDIRIVMNPGMLYTNSGLYTLIMTATLLALSIRCTHGAWSSPVRDLIQHSSVLEEVLQAHVDAEQQRLDELKSLLAKKKDEMSRWRAGVANANPETVKEERETSNNVMPRIRFNEQDIDNYLAHPINAFREIRAWSLIHKTVTTRTGDQAEHMRELLQSMNSKIRIPNQHCENTVIKNILHLQYFHNVSVQDILEGNISDTLCPYTLNADDMLQIANTASVSGHLLLAAQWLVYAGLHSDEHAHCDNIVDTLVSILSHLAEAKIISKEDAMIMTRWVYVDDRNVEKRKEAFTKTLHVVLSAHANGPQNPYDMLTVSLKKRCEKPRHFEDIKAEFMDAPIIVLSRTELEEMVNFGDYLWEMSFHVEGLRTSVSPVLLNLHYRDYVQTTVERVAKEAGKICRSCHLRKAIIEEQAYSFQIMYDSPGHSGYSFVVESTEFRNQQVAMSGVHIILFGTSPVGGAVIPYTGCNPIIPTQNQALIWRTFSVPYGEQQPIWCPTLYGERRIVHIFIRTS